MPERTRRATLALISALVLAVSACTSDADTGAPASDASELAILPANFDLAVGEGRRLLLGVFTDRRERVAGGSVTVRLAHLGDQPGGTATPGEPLTATFLPVPGLDLPVPDDGPAVVGSDALTGVYRLEVDLDAPGFWGVQVSADLAGVGALVGQTVIRVLESTQVIDVGDPAPPTPNVVRADVEAGAAPASTLDSRLRTAEERDRAEVLHTTRVDESLAAGRPVVIAITTPVYCVSLVCGPLTEYLVDVAGRFGDRADFVHVEVWEDFDEQRLSPAAAAWILPAEGSGNEPWVFLVGPDGTVLARWDNVVDPVELEAALSALPALDVS